MNMPLGKRTSNSDFKKCSSMQTFTYPKPKGRQKTNQQKNPKPTNKKLQKMLGGISIICPGQSAVGIKRRIKHKV